MATIKDIAILAGVSHGTVSNVLNKRGNVSAEKINLVENAARELGFKLNAQAKQLRQGHSDKVAVLVPRINAKQYCDLYTSMNGALRQHGYETELYCSNDLNHCEEELIETIISSNPAAVVVVSSFLKNPGIFNEVSKSILVERYVENMPGSTVFASFDYGLAGRELGLRCCSDGHRQIAVVSGPARFSHNREFIDGITRALEENKCTCQVFSPEASVGFQTVVGLAAGKYRFDAVVAASLEQADYMKQIRGYGLTAAEVPVYTLASQEIGADSSQTRYELNYKLCGKRIAQYIVKTENGEEVPKDYLKLENTGFYSLVNTEKRPAADRDLNILMLASPTSEALKSLLPSFALKTGIQVKLMEVTYDELYKSARDSEYSSVYDLIRLDMAWLSEMGGKLFCPLDLEDPGFENIIKQFSPHLPDDYFKVGSSVYALPFDPSVQILYYRKDLFEDALIKREFYERYKRQLEIPENFNDYNEVAQFFTRTSNSKSPTEFGTSLVFGGAVVAACDYLPRLKALGGVPFDAGGRVQINTPVVKEALENYVKTYQYTNQTSNLWWQGAAESFAEGETAMNIVFSNHASAMLHNPHSQVVGKIGFASVPGGCPMLGGGIIGISKNSSRQKECMEFLNWIYDEKTAAMITYLGGYIHNKSLTENADVLELYPWIEGMEKAFRIGWRRGNRKNGQIFDEYKFEEILGGAVRAAVSGLTDIDMALNEAQDKCDHFLTI